MFPTYGSIAGSATEQTPQQLFRATAPRRRLPCRRSRRNGRPFPRRSLKNSLHSRAAPRHPGPQTHRVVRYQPLPSRARTTIWGAGGPPSRRAAAAATRAPVPGASAALGEERERGDGRSVRSLDGSGKPTCVLLSSILDLMSWSAMGGSSAGAWVWVASTLMRWASP